MSKIIVKFLVAVTITAGGVSYLSAEEPYPLSPEEINFWEKASKVRLPDYMALQKIYFYAPKEYKEGYKFVLPPPLSNPERDENGLIFHMGDNKFFFFLLSGIFSQSYERMKGKSFEIDQAGLPGNEADIETIELVLNLADIPPENAKNYMYCRATEVKPEENKLKQQRASRRGNYRNWWDSVFSLMGLHY